MAICRDFTRVLCGDRFAIFHGSPASDIIRVAFEVADTHGLEISEVLDAAT